MSETQGGGALEPHNNPYFTKTNGDSHGHHMTELSSTSDPPTHHLTLLKSASSSSPTSSNSSGLPSLFTFGDGEGLGSRLSDAFSEIRYAELSPWDLNLNTYSTEGLTARLIDTRSIDGQDPYRPWEKPDSNSNPTHQSPTSTSNGNPVPSVHPASTPTPENGISSTNDKSPTTLTPLTNVYTPFPEPFHPNQNQTPQGPPSSQKLALPSFQSQFNPFQDTPSTSGTPTSMENTITTPTIQTPTLPSFHTLPANRAVSVGVYHQPQQGHGHPYLEERHIQIFPGQVQFGQIIATGPPPQHHSQQLHHGNNGTVVTTNGHPHFIQNGGHGTPFNVNPQQGQTTTIQLQELVPVPHHILHITNGKGHTTDGLIIHHDPHHGHGPHPHPPPININMPKYIHGAGIVPGTQETHLIAVNPNMLHHHQHQPQLIQHQHNGHAQQITKLEQQCSPNTNGMGNNNVTPNRNPTPKRQVNRKRKTNNLDHQGLVDPHQNPHPHPHHNHNGGELDPQVSSVSSTESDFHLHRRPMNGMNLNGGNGNGGMLNGTPNQNLHAINVNGGSIMTTPHDNVDPGLDKPVKKKRKRCGECIGCQRKDNCGDCAPCRNDKSHQICKMRRCDKLTEKKTPKVKLKQQQQH